MEYKADEETELREAVEKGRRAKIAYEVLCKYLDACKERTIRQLENMSTSDMDTTRALVECLQVMSGFREAIRRDIDIGEFAEERMNEIGR